MCYAHISVANTCRHVPLLRHNEIVSQTFRSHKRLDARAFSQCISETDSIGGIYTLEQTAYDA